MNKLLLSLVVLSSFAAFAYGQEVDPPKGVKSHLINGTYVVDGIYYMTIQQAITAAGSAGAVEIPSNYAGLDTYTNPIGITILDMRVGKSFFAVIPPTTSILKGTGTKGVSAPASASDIAVLGTLSNSITGNAFTATQLAVQPITCPNGQVATGITSSGNPALCLSIATSTFTPSLTYVGTNSAGNIVSAPTPVTSFTVASTNGLSGLLSGGSTPILTLSLGAINPTSVGATTAGSGTFTSIIDTGLAASTAPVCPNGPNGTFTTTGCAGSSSSLTGLSIANANGVSGSVTTGNTPVVTLALGAINPTSIGATTPSSGIFSAINGPIGTVSPASGVFSGVTVNGAYTQVGTATNSFLGVTNFLSIRTTQINNTGVTNVASDINLLPTGVANSTNVEYPSPSLYFQESTNNSGSTTTALWSIQARNYDGGNNNTGAILRMFYNGPLTPTVGGIVEVPSLSIDRIAGRDAICGNGYLGALTTNYCNVLRSYANFSNNATGAQLMLPDFGLNVTTLSQAESFSIAAPMSGFGRTCMEFIQSATSGPYTVTPPSNVLGFFTVGTLAGKRNMQCFYYDGSNWLAESTGIINF